MQVNLKCGTFCRATFKTNKKANCIKRKTKKEENCIRFNRERKLKNIMAKCSAVFEYRN